MLLLGGLISRGRVLFLFNNSAPRQTKFHAAAAEVLQSQHVLVETLSIFHFLIMQHGLNQRVLILNLFTNELYQFGLLFIYFQIY